VATRAGGWIAVGALLHAKLAEWNVLVLPFGSIEDSLPTLRNSTEEKRRSS
jgi:hypothetical protein